MNYNLEVPVATESSYRPNKPPIKPKSANRRPSDNSSQYEMLVWNYSTQSASSLTALDKLSKVFRFTRDGAISAFFRQNYSIVDWLIRSREALQVYFGPDATFTLKATNDKYGEDSTQLVVYIETRATTDSAMAQMDEFEIKWLSQQGVFFEDKIIFNLALI